MNTMDLSHIWANIDGLKAFDLCSNDEDLRNVSLLDWLAITLDNKLAAYLAERLERQHLADKLIDATQRYKAGEKSRREAVENEGKPTKKALRSDMRSTTAQEIALRTGVPPKDASPTTVHSLPGCSENQRPFPAEVGSREIDDGWLNIAASIYESQQGGRHG